MSMEEQFKGFMDVHKENIKMAMLHGNFDEAMKIVFSAGYICAHYQGDEIDSDNPENEIDDENIN